jgi:hypothetical protein
MAITRARTSSVAQGPSTRKTVLGGNDVILPGSYDAIGTVALSSSQTTVTFSSIPQTYKHLQVRIFARSNRATFPVDDPVMQLNGDTGNNYTNHTVYGDGATVGTFASAPRSNIRGAGSLASSAGSGWSAGVVDILDYTNTSRYKTVRWLQGYDTNGTVAGYGGLVVLTSGAWMNTNAITSISFEVEGARSYTQYSQFDLYGIK